jgi:hypothetical protein
VGSKRLYQTCYPGPRHVAAAALGSTTLFTTAVECNDDAGTKTMKQQLAYLSSCHNTHITASVLLPLVCFPPSQHNLSPMACILLFSPSFPATIPGSSNGTKRRQKPSCLCNIVPPLLYDSKSILFSLLYLRPGFVSSHEPVLLLLLFPWPRILLFLLPQELMSLSQKPPPACAISLFLFPRADFTSSFHRLLYDSVLCSPNPFSPISEKQQLAPTYLPTGSPLFFSKLPTKNFKPAKRIHHIQIHP